MYNFEITFTKNINCQGVDLQNRVDSLVKLNLDLELFVKLGWKGIKRGYNPFWIMRQTYKSSYNKTDKV